MLREKKEICLLLSKLQVIVRRNVKRISADKISKEKKSTVIHSDTRSVSYFNKPNGLLSMQTQISNYLMCNQM